MKRIFLEVAYDGTCYCGWQIQKNALSIEEVLNRTLSGFLGEEIRVKGASRTDAGVHALGNVAVFDTETTIPPDRIGYAVNPHLPEDIRIVLSKEVPGSFHPRYTDSEKTYEYHILNERFPYPTRRYYTYLVTYPLDEGKMRSAASYLVGTHDFASFCASGTQVKSTVRTIRSLRVWTTDYPREIVLEVRGNGFLYNMVRIIAGTLVKAGLGIFAPEYVREILEAKDRRKAGETAPARGLLLKKITFSELSK